MHVHLKAISKRFGPLAAVTDASLQIAAGEVVALLGENGAGKSTLMKVLYGVHAPDNGSIEIDGRAVTIDSSRSAIAAGIGMVFQQFSLIPALSVRENLALATPGTPWWLGRDARRMNAIDRDLATLVPGLDPARLAGTLPAGLLQRVELAKVLRQHARCVILDEPSALLTPDEAAVLWQAIGDLSARGVAVVLITHKLGDVRACASRVAVMRAGRVVAEVPVDDADDARIVQWMVGEAPPVARPSPRPSLQAPVRLAMRGVRVGMARDIDLEIRAGEVVGIAGISGNGQTELADAVAGARPIERGAILLNGVDLRSPRRSTRVHSSGTVGYIAEQPIVNAVAPDLSLTVNLALKRIASLPWLVPHAALRARADELIERYDVRPGNPDAQANWLSGGNLQKLVVARELSDGPAVVVACYPTMGLDLTATAQVYAALFGLARDGCAVLWISEDLDDLMRHTHRIAVIAQGRLVQMFDARSTSAHELGHWMTGLGGEADRAEVDCALERDVGAGCAPVLP